MSTPSLKKRLVLIAIVASTSVLLYGILPRDKKKPDNLVFSAVLKAPKQATPLYGFNGNNTVGPSWANKAFRDSAETLHFKIIRYPGGSVGDYWDWRRGWFVADSDQLQKNGLALPDEFKKMKYSKTGLGELKLLTDETHCDVIFVLNMLTRDLDDQIEMLKSAQSLGIPIKWVELGNEFNLKYSAYRKKFAMAKDYGVACNRWIKAVKANFPEAKVATVGGNFNYDSDIKGWNDEVINEANDADAIVAHIYPACFQVVDNDGINFESLYQSFNQNFDDEGFTNIKKNIWVTEYNIHWAFFKPGMDREAIQKYALTWGQTLSTLLMTSLATSLPREAPQIIMNHNITGSKVFAAIETRKDDSFKKLPNGIGMKIWLDACNTMHQSQKITLKNGGKTVNDYEAIGWDFSNANSSNLLLVNFMDKPITIDLSKIMNGNTAVDYIEKSAEKNKIIDNEYSDVTTTRKTTEHNTVVLNKYSVVILKI